MVSEWSAVSTAPGTGKRLINRGTEWYVLRDSLIPEVQAHFIPAAGANVELATFPYRERGYRPTPAGPAAAGTPSKHCHLTQSH